MAQERVLKLIEEKGSQSYYSQQEIKAQFETCRKEEDCLYEKIETFDKSSFKKYSPLVSDLRKDSKIALFSNSFLLIRRMILFYMAMFVVK